jgi:hypothetical protein
VTRIMTVVLLVTGLAAPAHAHGDLKLVNGLWFDGRGFAPRTVYVVDDVFRESYAGETRTVDLGGRYVVPPFADAHNHGLGDPRSLALEATRFLRTGVFYVSNPNNLGDRVAAVRQALSTPETVDARFANGGLTATGGHPAPLYERLARHGVFPGLGPADMEGRAYFAVDTAADLDRQWPRILAGKPNFLKVYLERSEEPGRRGLDPALLAPIVARAHAEGLKVSAHVTSAADVRVAVEAGVDELAHLPLAALTAEDAQAMAARGVVVVTTVLSHRPVPEGLDLMDLHRRNLQSLKTAGVRVVLGVDGEGTVVDEALAVARLGVYTTAEVVRMLVETTPRHVFPGRRIGSLEPGAEASLLALDGNPLEDPEALRRVAMRIKQGHVLEIAPEKKSVVPVLAPVVLERGVPAALEELAKLPADTWDVGERALNALGYEMMIRRGRTDLALELFKLNAERYPASPNVWDSLGEAYLKAGDRAQAAVHYRKALELNPHNEQAAKVLREIATP